MTLDARQAHAGEANTVTRPMLGERSVLVLDEAPHMEQRKLLLPPFHGERMQAYTEIMERAAAKEIESWPTGQPIALWPRMQAITLEVIVRAVFGFEGAEEVADASERLRQMLDLATNARRLLVPTLILGTDRIRRLPYFRRAVEPSDELIHEAIRRHRAMPDLAEREDILSLLVQARHEDGEPMSDEEIRDELMTLLVAGHETTATALAWGLERLVRHPEMLQRLREEIEAGEDSYLDAVVKETLRLRPSIALVGRKLTEPLEIGGYRLPPGVTLAPCIFLVHRRPDIYPEPDRFLPDRFLDTKPGTYSWIPFGGGVRRCIGASFAQLEMKIVLREIVRRLDLAPDRPDDESYARRAIFLVPERGARVVATPSRERVAA
jgi:cytochrome P450